MAKYSTILTTTLLATSAVAFSANASSNFDIFDDLNYGDFTVSTRTVAQDDSRHVVFGTQNTIDPSAEQAKAVKAKVKHPRLKVPKANFEPKESPEKMFATPNSDSRKSADVTKRYTGKTWTVDISNPKQVTFVSRDVKDTSQEAVLRTLDFNSAADQAKFFETLRVRLENDNAVLTWRIELVKSLKAAYDEKYSPVWNVKDEVYNTALKPVLDKLLAVKPGLKPENRPGKETAQKIKFSSKNVAKDQASVEKAHAALNKEFARKFSAQTFEYNSQNNEAANLVQQRAELFKLQVANIKLADEMHANMKVSTHLEPFIGKILDGSAKYITPAPAAPVETPALEAVVVETPAAAVEEAK